MNRPRSPFLLFFISLFLLLSACSDTPKREKLASTKPHNTVLPRPSLPQPAYQPTTYSGIFPKPGSLEPAVDFWRKTYAIWHRSEVAFHDDRHMNIIYEVFNLPGVVGEGLTTEQRMVMDQRREYWKSQVSSLEAKLRYGAALNAADKQLIGKLESSGKPVNEVIQGASDRVRAQRGTRERFKRGMEISGRYDLQFRKIFRDAGLPEELAYLPHVESSFQTHAKSSAGAVGLWQFTKAAAKTFMPNGDDSLESRLDPFLSANGAARYLSYAYGKLHDWPTAITSYNHGIGGMKRAQNQVSNDFSQIVERYDHPSFGFASRNYYAQFIAAREIASNPRQYFAEGVIYETPLPGAYLAAD